MNIRLATNADAPAIQSLVSSVLSHYGLPFEPTGVDSDLYDIENAYASGIFEVVEDEGEIVGSVALFPRSAEVCELRKMYLKPGYRGRGLGRQLLERMLAAARRRGFRRMELETNSCLIEATRLYERYGFTPISAPHLATRCDRALALELGKHG